jgi:hypothetical protein
MRVGVAEVGNRPRSNKTSILSLGLLVSRIEKIEAEIQAMSPEERADFRAWFAEFDSNEWDRQLESDLRSGKLDAFADSAIRDHDAGHTTKL